MSENQPPEGNPPTQPDVEEPMADRRLAHERLSTGGLARWMRACASHPWRVIVSWLGIIAALIVLVATVGGSLKDEFSIPGSDTQQATDLIESEFVEEQGGVLNLVFAAPEGERLDTPERKAAVEAAIAKLKTDEFAPTGTDPEGKAGIKASVTRSTRTRSRTTGASRMPRRSSTVSSTRRIASASWMWRTQCVTRSSRPA